MKAISIILILALVLFVNQTSAVVYKYEDEQGNLHFTDDINQVPEDQRDALEIDIEYESDPEAEEAAQLVEGSDDEEIYEESMADEFETDPELESSYQDEPAQSEDLEADAETDLEEAKEDGQLQENQFEKLAATPASELEEERKRLEAMKAEIDREYDQLVKVKEALAKEKEKLTTREDVVNHNAKIKNLNKRAKAYTEKGKQYKEQVEAYNQRVTEQNLSFKQKKQ